MNYIQEQLLDQSSSSKKKERKKEQEDKKKSSKHLICTYLLAKNKQTYYSYKEVYNLLFLFL